MIRAAVAAAAGGDGCDDDDDDNVQTTTPVMGWRAPAATNLDCSRFRCSRNRQHRTSLAGDFPRQTYKTSASSLTQTTYMIYEILLIFATSQHMLNHHHYLRTQAVTLTIAILLSLYGNRKNTHIRGIKRKSTPLVLCLKALKLIKFKMSHDRQFPALTTRALKRFLTLILLYHDEFVRVTSGGHSRAWFAKFVATE